MILTFPTFYRDFKCIANRCTDSCCIGWEIDIDEDNNKYLAYRLAGNSLEDFDLYFLQLENEKKNML